MTETETDTTTKFIGDIIFNNGDKDINASDLVTVDEVNEALDKCVKRDALDNVLKSDRIVIGNYVTKVFANDNIHDIYQYFSYDDDDKNPQEIHIDVLGIPGDIRIVETVKYIGAMLNILVYNNADNSVTMQIASDSIDVTKGNVYYNTAAPGSLVNSIKFDVPITTDVDRTTLIPSLKYVNDNFIQSDKVDSLVDVFNSSDPSPSSADSLTLRTDFEFSDEHLMSSLAVKMLLDKLEKRIAALEQS